MVLRRYSEFQNLEGAFGRRAITERAKGILMARHLMDEREAFELLRTHSRRTGRKLVDVAAAVVDVHQLLPPTNGVSAWSEDSGAVMEAHFGAAASER